jgi:hypothetical protein
MKIALLILFGLFNVPPKRKLNIYAMNKADPLFSKQITLLNADPEGLLERDIVVVEHLGFQGFKITLTGKDGSEKYSSTKIFELLKLYEVIDAMPMRREEILNSKKYHE